MKKMTLIYIQKENQTLFLKRNKKGDLDISHGKFLGVGGKVESYDKSVYDSAVREMKEETNLTANKLIKKGIVNFIGQRLFPVEVTVYICNDFYGQLKSDDREGSLDWIDNHDILNLNLWEGDKIFLPKLFEDKEFNLNIYYKDNKMTHWEYNE